MLKSASYKEVLKQLNSFIRKYYLNKTIQGVLIVILIFALSIGAMILSSQGFRLNVQWRTVGFMSLAVSLAILFIWLVIVPFIQYLGLARALSYKKAERLLSSHFAEMKDTLLNMLELAENYDDKEDNSLILASIEDKADRIKWYRFTSAVPMRKLLRYLPYLAGVILLGSLSYILWPDFVKQGYARTLNYRTDFDLPPVYSYKILNDSLLVSMGKDIEIRVEPQFDAGMEPVYFRMGQNREQMEAGDKGVYSFVVKALNNDASFRLQYRGIISDPFDIGVLPTPELVQFSIQTFPPAYTGLKGLVMTNEGDLDLPVGSRVNWSINAMNTDAVTLIFPDDTLTAENKANSFSVSKRLTDSGRYKISLSNNKTEEKPEMGFRIRVIPDLYPEIDLNEIRDSLIETQFFFQGYISDDYGFSKLEFNLERMDGSSVIKKDLLLSKNSTGMRFYHAEDLSEAGNEGEQLFYYFSVWDNDGVNGFKRTDSDKKAYRNLTYSELVDQNKGRAESIEKTLDKGKDLTEQLKETVEEMKMSQLMEERENWEMKSKLKEMEEMQRLLEDMIQNINEENQIKGLEQEKFNIENQRLAQKQEEIQKLLENIMDDELKKLLEEFEKLVEENNRGEKLEKLDEMDLNLDKLERQLDVSLELLKRYEIEKEVFRTSHELERLGNELDKLDPEQDSARMDEIREEYEELNENYQEQLDENEELKEPMELEDFDQERKEISEDTEKMNDKNSGKKQQQEKKKEASEKMKEMGEKMRQMMLGGQAGEMVDLEVLRQLARELNDFSFKQEDLLDIVKKVNVISPEYAKVAVEERELTEKFSVIRDTLVNIGYKQPQIAGLLNQEMFHVETALANMMKSFQDGRKTQVAIDQQNVMTGANELAVRLDEIVQSAQSQSGSGGGGESPFKDSNPQSGKDQVGEMKKQQQSLKDQLEGMIQKMKNGQRGKQDKEGLAKMLAEREMMRQALERLKNSGEVGQDTKGKLSEVQKLIEEVEKDIIYDRLGNQTIRREKMIETKLLEAEQAEMEREQENKRESREFKGTLRPPDIEEWEKFEKEKKRTLELMKYRDIKLREFYRKKYYDYLDLLEKQKK